MTFVIGLLAGIKAEGREKANPSSVELGKKFVFILIAAHAKKHSKTLLTTKLN